MPVLLARGGIQGCVDRDQVSQLLPSDPAAGLAGAKGRPAPLAPSTAPTRSGQAFAYDRIAVLPA